MISNRNLKFARSWRSPWWCVDVRNSVGTASNGSLAGAAVPDTGGLSSDSDLTAESAGVLGVLGDFHLLHLLSQGGTVTITSRISFQFVLGLFPATRIECRRVSRGISLEAAMNRISTSDSSSQRIVDGGRAR